MDERQTKTKTDEEKIKYIFIDGVLSNKWIFLISLTKKKIKIVGTIQNESANLEEGLDFAI